MIRGMKPHFSHSFAGSVIAGSAMFLLLAFSAYIAGYLLLPNKNGLYHGEWQYELFKPAMYAQRWITRQEVSSGYIDPAEIHWSKSLPYPPPKSSSSRSVPLPIPSGVTSGMPTPAPRTAKQSPTPRRK
jgi:hypothetical protein